MGRRDMTTWLYDGSMVVTTALTNESSEDVAKVHLHRVLSILWDTRQARLSKPPSVHEEEPASFGWGAF